MLQEIENEPALFASKVARPELQLDLTKLEALEKTIKPYADRIVAHHDKRGIAQTPKYSNLREGVAILGDIFRRYYTLIEGADLSLTVNYLEDFDIFTLPWIENVN